MTNETSSPLIADFVWSLRNSPGGTRHRATEGNHATPQGSSSKEPFLQARSGGSFLLPVLG